MKVINTYKTWTNPLIILLMLLISISSATQNLVSDVNNDLESSYLRLPSIKSVESCEQSYGFLPCSTTMLGNAFLIVVYGYLMYTAAAYLSNGSELLLEILGPGIIGGLFLPIFGALPEAMIVLVSGLFGTLETAQDQVSVGMGMLAGSTVMRLTIVWGGCVLVGKCDLDRGYIVARDEIDTKGFSLTESGVSTDIWTIYVARIMAFSVLPFLVVQLPQALKSSSGRHLAVLIALVLSIVMLISYCVYQVFQPWIQKRKLYYVKHRRVMTGFLHHLKRNAFGKLCDRDGNINKGLIEEIFKRLDNDNSGTLSRGELGAFIVGMNIEGLGVGKDDIVEKIMEYFGSGNQGAELELEQFTQGISNLIQMVKVEAVLRRRADSDTNKALLDCIEEAEIEHLLLGDYSGEGGEKIQNPTSTTIKAILFIVLGIIIAAIFAEPLVDVVTNFSYATNIPSFFISFIALPTAMNFGDAVSVLISSSRKTKRFASLTFSQLYGAVTMNNVLCLSVFLALIYGRGLAWDFSSEVLVILLVCVINGVLSSFRTVFPVWMSFVAFLLYPLSLALVYVLDYVFGW